MEQETVEGRISPGSKRALVGDGGGGGGRVALHVNVCGGVVACLLSVWEIGL